MGEVLVLSQILNIKLSSFTMVERKRGKEDTHVCTGVNRGVPTYVLTLQVSYLRLFLWWLWFVVLLDLLAPPPLFSIIERTLRGPHR
jgi:hypothetical protein